MSGAEDFRENLRSALMRYVYVGRTQKDGKWGWWAGDADKVRTRHTMRDDSPDAWLVYGFEHPGFMGAHDNQGDAINAGIDYLLKCRPDIVISAKKEANEGQAYRSRQREK